MVPTRRRFLQIGGATTLAALAGCTTRDLLGSKDTSSEYSLTVDSIDAPPVEYALYEPDDGALFGEPARTALDNVLPDGRHTSYGYKPPERRLRGSRGVVLPDETRRHRGAHR